MGLGRSKKGGRNGQSYGPVIDPYMPTRRSGFGMREAPVPNVTWQQLREKDEINRPIDIRSANAERKKMRDKEWNLMTCIGPNSVGDRHYPQSFMLSDIKREREE